MFTLPTALVIATLYVLSRLTTPTAEQRQALALLESQVVAGESNAFADLWLLPYEIPEADKAAVLDEDIARFRAHLDSRPGPPSDDAVAFRSVAGERYAGPSTHVLNLPPLCESSGSECLARVRESRQAYAERLSGEQALLRRHLALHRHDHHRSLFEHHHLAPLPALRGLSLPLTQAALDFVEGRTEPALTAICESTRAWRRITANSDLLILPMTGAAILQGNSSTFAQMLAELPRDHDLPAACHVAFQAPETSELSICKPMAGELRFVSSMIADLSDKFASDAASAVAGLPWSTLVFEPGRTRAMAAAHYAWPCTDEARRLLLADAPARPPMRDTRLWRLECLGNMAGCVMTDIARANYDDYQLRIQDIGAQLRTVATLLELRATCRTGSVAACLARQARATAETARPISVSDDGRLLQVKMYSDRWGPAWSVPLPPWLGPEQRNAF